MACSLAPHELLRRTGIGSERICAAFGVGASYASHVGNAVNAARGFRDVVAGVGRCSADVYTLAEHVAVSDPFNEDSFRAALVPQIPALLALNVTMRAADATLQCISWGNMRALYEVAAGAAGKMTGATNGAPDAAFDEILAATSFGAEEAGHEAAEEAEEAGHEEAGEAGNEEAVDPAVDRISRAEPSGDPLERLGGAVTESGSRLTYIKTVVWRTLVATGAFFRRAMPVALFATAIFAVLFACCSMLGFGNYGENQLVNDIPVCGAIKYMCQKDGPLSFLLDFTQPRLGGLDQRTTLRLAEAIKAAKDATNAPLVSRLVFDKRFKDWLSRGATGQRGDAFAPGFVERAINWGRSWTSAAPTSAEAHAGVVAEIDAEYAQQIDALFWHGPTHGMKWENIAHKGIPPEPKRLIDAYMAKTGFAVGKYDTLFTPEHREFVRQMHKYIWTQSTALSLVFGAAHRGPLRAIGDLIGINDGIGESRAAMGAAIVTLAILAMMYLGPIAGASVLATAAAFVTSFDYTDNHAAAMGVAVMVFNQIRQFVPTTEKEESQLDAATQVALKLSQTAQETMDATRRARSQQIQAVGGALSALPVVGGLAAAGANVMALDALRSKGAEQAAARRREATGGLFFGKRPFV
jgi:hypothetical protein